MVRQRLNKKDKQIACSTQKVKCNQMYVTPNILPFILCQQASPTFVIHVVYFKPPGRPKFINYLQFLFFTLHDLKL